MVKDVNLESPVTEREWIRNDVVAVSTTSVEVAPARSRKMIFIRNTSDDDTKIITVHLGYGVSVANYGIVLKRNESFADSNSGDNYVCTQGTITAICAVAGGQISVVER